MATDIYRLVYALNTQGFEERKRAIEQAVSEAVNAEREACAAMCTAENEEGDFVYDTRAELAEAIRARGERQTEENA